VTVTSVTANAAFVSNVSSPPVSATSS
jgi:hypothetical protein